MNTVQFGCWSVWMLVSLDDESSLTIGLDVNLNSSRIPVDLEDQLDHTLCNVQ